MKLRYPIIFCLLGLVLLGAMRPTYAQSAFILGNATDRSIDLLTLQIATQDITSRGGTLAIFIDPQGTEPDMLRLLRQEALYHDTRVHEEVIVVYIGLADRYTNILYGANWDGDLSPEIVARIQAEHLAPALDDEDLTPALVAAVDDINDATNDGVPLSGPLIVLVVLLLFLVALYAQHLRRAYAKNTAET
ncbi:MAG: hypothetical protein ACLFTK_05205 [Anaerolineales bacterium]